MGHYTTSRAFDENKLEKKEIANRKKAKKHLQAALTHSDSAYESEIFRVKIKEAIFWLENSSLD